MNYNHWFNTSINNPDFLGKDINKAAWNYQQEKIEKLEAENKKLKEESSRLLDYTYDLEDTLERVREALK